MATVLLGNALMAITALVLIVSVIAWAIRTAYQDHAPMLIQRSGRAQS